MATKLIDLIRQADYDLDALLVSERESWLRDVLVRRFEHRCEQFEVTLDLSRTGLIAGPIQLWVEAGSPTTDSPSGARTVAEAFVDIHRRSVDLLCSKAEQMAKAIYDTRYDAKEQVHRKELLQLELQRIQGKEEQGEINAFDEVGIRLDLNSANPSYAVGFIPDEYNPALIQATARDDAATNMRTYTKADDVQVESELSFSKRYRFSIHGRYIHVIPPTAKMLVVTVQSEALADMEDEHIEAKEKADKRAKEITAEELRLEMNAFKFNESLVADIVPQLNEAMLRQALQMTGAEIRTGAILEGFTAS